MKFLYRPLCHFYKTDVTTSECQLRTDFGDFPPKPLLGDCLPGEFTVVRVRGIGEQVHFAIMMKRLAEGAADLNSLSPAIRNYMPGELESLKRFFGGKGVGKNILMCIALVAIFIAGAVNFIRVGRQGVNSFGFFAPLRRDECEIVVKVGKIEKQRLDAASMISHEHIHLLQHKERQITAHSRVVSLSDDQLFTEAARASEILPHIKYLLERNEVEARLHELVVSFYRVHKNLPLSVPGFLALLAASKQLGWLVSETLTEANVGFGPVLAEFVERDKIQAKDLEMVLLSVSDDLMPRFITEVLPIMYGNLLKYYGDDAASRNFFSQIERPNFYDQLYSLSKNLSVGGEVSEATVRN